MSLLKDKQKEQLTDLFSSLTNPVKIVMFSQEVECEPCRLTREMLEDISALSDKISLEVFDFVEDTEEKKKYGIDKIPAVILRGDVDYGIRFYGVPAGYEFTTLIEDIISVSLRSHGLSDEVIAQLEKIDEPVLLEVLVSPTCPVCPAAVRIAHRLAMANENIRAEMIETSEFPHLVNKYDVQGVPHTVINKKDGFVGAVPEMEVVNIILLSLGKEVPKEFLEAMQKRHEEHGHDNHNDHDHEE